MGSHLMCPNIKHRDVSGLIVEAPITGVSDVVGLTIPAININASKRQTIDYTNFLRWFKHNIVSVCGLSIDVVK